MSSDLLRSNPEPELQHPILAHLPMVRSIARSIHRSVPQSVDLDELFSAGLLGLVQAASNFDPAKQSKFTGFASFRIRGAIMDCLRELDWAPRDLRRKGRLAEKAKRARTSPTGQPPTQEDVAEELHISLHAYQLLLGDIERAQIADLTYEAEDGSRSSAIELVPDPCSDQPFYLALEREMACQLARAIDALPDRMRLIVTLHYFDEMQLSDIGRALGLSPSRVSQLRKDAELLLRETLTGGNL